MNGSMGLPHSRWSWTAVSFSARQFHAFGMFVCCTSKVTLALML